MPGPLIIGHRGAAGLVAENTLAGFEHAIRLGVDGVELDVRMAGAEVVVIHDESVDRTTDGTGRVGELSFWDLRRLDAGGGEPIPTLAEVLEILPADIMLNVELKGPGTAAAVSRLVADRSDVVGDEPAIPPVLVSSFDEDELRHFHELSPEVPCAPLAARWNDQLETAAKAVDAWSINLSERIATPPHVAAIRGWGRRCLVYTVNEPARLRELWALGVSGVFTDYPDRLVGDSASRLSNSASSRCSS